MDKQFEEEKKDATEELIVRKGEKRGNIVINNEAKVEGVKRGKIVINNEVEVEVEDVERGNIVINNEVEDEDKDEELCDLPLEVPSEIRTKHYDFEKELEKELEEAGFGDLKVVLVGGEARLVTPSDYHNKFTIAYVPDFILWANNKWGLAAGTNKIHLQNGRTREPDISYWGYHRCIYNERKRLVPSLKDEDIPIPDVIIQFSWKNTRRYEKEAIEDIMSEGLEEQGGGLSTIRPRLGYLIMVIFTNQQVTGLDIYRLSHGTTIADAHDPNNHDAQHWTYVPGGPEIWITIEPEALGITGFWAWVCGTYKLEASLIFRDMRKLQESRQARGIAN